MVRIMQHKQPIKTHMKAPDFTLEDHNGKPFKLSEHKGKKILLSFHPLAWTPVCAKQMKTLDDNKGRFDETNTIAVGVSVDAVPSKNAWAKDLAITMTRLVSDFWPHGKVAQTYGIFRENDGFSERANVIIDENQNIAWVKVYPISQLPDINEVFRALENTSTVKISQ